MLIVPINDVVSQIVYTTLANQACQINLYTKSTGFYADLYVSGNLILGGVLCQDRNRIVRDGYLGFIGDLCFCDTQGTGDPVSPGLGARFLLLYLDATDVAALGQ